MATDIGASMRTAGGLMSDLMSARLRYTVQANHRLASDDCATPAMNDCGTGISSITALIPKEGAADG